MFRPDYPIETARLLLRPFDAKDLDDFHAYRSLPEVHRYLDNKAGCADLLAKRLTEHELTAEGQRLVLAVYLPEAQRVIGDVALKWHSAKQGEIGYSLHPEFQGKGYAREAAQAMLRVGFERMKLHRIVGECDPRNEPSWRLMERLGMRKEPHLRPLVYTMLEEEYRRVQA